MAASLSRRSIVWVLFRIGLLGFGGPFVAIAMMEEEFVARRKWLTPEKFGELFAICKLLPGPIGPQMAISVARAMAGTLAGLLGGILFILPAIVLVTGIAVLYTSGHEMPKQEVFFKGLQLGALAAIAVSVYQLFKPIVGDPKSWLIAALNCTVTFFVPAYEPLYILGTGFAGVLRNRPAGGPIRTKEPPSGKLHGVLVTAGVAGAFPASSKLMPLFFWTCLKSSAFIFGTGLAILPLLEHSFVAEHHWITHAQFMDSIAVGQVTPGPFMTSVSFVGYLMAGFKGAFVGSVGIFLPSFINVLIIVPMVWKRFFAGSRSVPFFMAWALPAVVGCISAAALKLGLLSVLRPMDGVVLVVGILALVTRVVPGWAVIIGSGVLNLILP